MRKGSKYVDFDAWVQLPVKVEHDTKIWKKKVGILDRLNQVA